jgi:hypothetical protein
VDAVDARWLKFVRPVDAKHVKFLRPTLKIYAAMVSAFSLGYFEVLTQNFGVMDAGMHLNGIATYTCRLLTTM